MPRCPSAARVAAIPKIPGVSARRLAAMIADAREQIVLGLTDSYGGHGEAGSEWVSEWKATAIDDVPIRYRNSDAVRYRVREAVLVSAENSASFVIHPSYGRRTKPELIPAISGAIASAIRGSWEGRAWFAWYGPYSDVSRVGETFESTGDARPFERAGVEGAIINYPDVHGGEYPVRIRVSRVGFHVAGSMRVTARLRT